MNFELTEKEAQRILNVLSKQPYSEVFDLISAMQLQGQEQLSKELVDDNNK